MIGKAAATGRGFHGVINYLVRGKLDKGAERRSGFDGIIDYLEQPKPGQQRQDRVAWRAVRNLMSNDPRMVTRIMRSTASRSRRCETPVYHLVLSWRQDENPTPDIMRQVADTTLADLKLSEHQAFLLAHHDTAHKHLHIIVNRVHPESLCVIAYVKDGNAVLSVLDGPALITRTEIRAAIRLLTTRQNARAGPRPLRPRSGTPPASSASITRIAMRPAKPPKLPGHLTPLQKRRLRKLWRDVHEPSQALIALLDLPSPKRQPRRRRTPATRTDLP